MSSQSFETTTATTNVATTPVPGSTTVKKSSIDIASLTIVAVLLAAGFILDFTVGKALAITGIQPEFIISSYCLALLLLRLKFHQAAIVGLLAAALIQLNTSIPGLEFVCDIPAAAICALAISALGKHSLKPIVPAALTFVTTLISGFIFATCAVLFFLKLEPVALLGMAPLVVSTAVANALVVEVLIRPLNAVVSKTATVRAR
jgi:hypothetical protein